jgi:hypothetical protein
MLQNSVRQRLQNGHIGLVLHCHLNFADQNHRSEGSESLHSFLAIILSARVEVLWLNSNTSLAHRLWWIKGHVSHGPKMVIFFIRLPQ